MKLEGLIIICGSFSKRSKSDRSGNQSQFAFFLGMEVYDNMHVFHDVFSLSYLVKTNIKAKLIFYILFSYLVGCYAEFIRLV